MLVKKWSLVITLYIQMKDGFQKKENQITTLKNNLAFLKRFKKLTMLSEEKSHPICTSR
jgi:hypothetical protein